MKYPFYFLVISLFLVPNLSWAAGVNGKCSSSGYTIVTINGVFTDKEGAAKNMDELKNTFRKATWREQGVDFEYLLNPSHLAGLGDIVMSVYQGVFDKETVEDYDLIEMLKTASEKVRTQKLLIVAHSQGNFYANSFYDSVAGKAGGIPAESIGVYGVATPASRVAGGGKWLTSDTDNVITGVVGHLPFKKIMEPNTHIALEGGDDSSGHSFSDVYLKYRGDKIISDIQTSLDALKENNTQDAEKPCLAPPKLTILHKAEGVLLAVADPAARASVLAMNNIAGETYSGASYLIAAAGEAFGKILSAGDGAQKDSESAIDVPQEPIPNPTPSKIAEASANAPVPTAKSVTNETTNHSDVGRLSEQTAVSPPSFLTLQATAPSPGFGGGSPAPKITENISVPPAIPPPDTTAPDISLSISECESSLSSDGCLVSNSTLHISWSSTAGDLNYYNLDFLSGTTTATSTIYTLSSDDSVYTFKAKAVDNSGNESGEVSKTVTLSTRPIVINEVAWAGTAASANDEWIELYNRSQKSVDLTNWVLRADDGVPYINLSGSIAAGGYYLIEKTNLNNSGEVLILSYASTTIDQTPAIGGSGCSSWCGGSASGAYPSMERIDQEVAGTDAVNWGTSNGVVKNGSDSAGTALTATPKARNSLHYLIAQGTTLASDRKLKKSFGTYIIPDHQTLIVSAGKTLTIEPGVTVKVGNESALFIEGTLKAEGTLADQIAFTALSDPPSPSWKTIKIYSGSAGSSIKYANFSYGGRFFSNTPTEERGELSIVNNSNSIQVLNSTFQNSLSAGARLTSSNATLSSNTFSAGTSTADKIGLYVVSGNPQISQNTFSQNYRGIVFEGGSGSVSDNVFNNNLEYAVYSTNGDAAFSGNSGSGNGKNGIALTGNIASAGATTTLAANSLPYVTRAAPYDNAKIPAGAGVEINSGVKIDGEDFYSEFTVNGTLKLNGAVAADIVFTSLADTAPAQWSGILVNTGGYVYGGGFTLRYGGGGSSCRPNCAGFRVLGGSVNLQNGLIQNNYLVGMRLYGAATSTLSNFEFRDHQTPAGDSTGLISVSSQLVLTNLIFSNNHANTSPANLY